MSRRRFRPATPVLALGLAMATMAVVTPSAAAAPPGPVDYSDPIHWICRPDTDDVCDHGLDATVIEADGTMTVEPFEADPDAPIDCFYVYPTISRDDAANSDLVPADSEERFAAANQVAPLGTGCRVFAPVYRQVTLAALAGTVDAGSDARALAYGDVVDAWHHYLDHDNGGRGVVLVGHSQGASILKRLIADEIDGAGAVRDLLVAAYLAGTSLQVPLGRDVGGDFQNVPLCRADEQYGCVATWSTYRASSPPPADAIFGRGGDGTEAGCTNPAALGGGRADLSSRFPATSRAGILAALGTTSPDVPWVEPSAGAVTTPFVVLPAIATGGCVHWSGYSWLEVSPNVDPGPRADDVGGDLTPPWGLHVIDMNLVMGDLQHLVDTQGSAWAAAH